ncbi:MAG: 50S ribosomal protein L1 [Alphaproteobacteria bacterium]|nr:50S ribosomal protein L1 [Alphaproteobacteria bacterium]MBN2779992.1 50S ribosomal protein L1 [Alphaproteobacteria bacterium]
MAKTSKRMKDLRATIESEKVYALSDAIALLKKGSKVKFDETVEIAVRLGLDPKKADQALRGMVALPNGTGKNVRVAVVVADAAKQDAVKKAGADVVGGEELIETIAKGTIDFDVCITTPDMMPKLAKVARVLGPKGLMPNPKLGTVTPDVEEAVKKSKAGQIEYRTDKNGLIHAGVGKLSFDEKKLEENINTLMDVLRKAKPQSAKGTYIRKVSLSSTMGAGITVDMK